MAYDIGYDIVIKDDEFELMRGEFDKRAEHFNTILKEYETILDQVIATGITSGGVNTNLKTFKESVKGLEDAAASIAEKAKKCTTDMVSDFDTADNCLF